MAEAAWEYRYFIASPVASVYAHLAEPDSYVGLSPLVVQVSDVRYSTGADGEPVCQYRSIERFRFLGIIRYDNPIDVTTRLTHENQELVSDVASAPNVRVRFKFTLEPENGGTRVTEQITARMPALVRSFVVSEARRVQQERARILADRLEASHP